MGDERRRRLKNGRWTEWEEKNFIAIFSLVSFFLLLFVILNFVVAHSASSHFRSSCSHFCYSTKKKKNYYYYTCFIHRHAYYKFLYVFIFLATKKIVRCSVMLDDEQIDFVYDFFLLPSFIVIWLFYDTS